jgi:hypothetical protein
MLSSQDSPINGFVKHSLTCGIDRAWLLSRDKIPSDDTVAELWLTLIKRRKQDVPIYRVAKFNDQKPARIINILQPVIVSETRPGPVFGSRSKSLEQRAA